MISSPLVLSLSKDRPSFGLDTGKEGQGFDKLSPNGVWVGGGVNG